MTANNESQCYFVQLQIDTFLDGDLNDKQQDVFMAHIHDCAGCAAELQFARKLHDEILDLPQLECPDMVLEPVYRLGQQANRPPVSIWAGLTNWLLQLPTPLRYGVPVTAALALTLSLGPLFVQDDTVPVQVAEQTPAEEYSQEDVVAALQDLNTAINYLNEVSQRTETMIGSRFVIMPLQDSLNASFERVQADQNNPLDDDPI